MPDQARTGSRKEYAKRILSTTLLRSSCVASTGSVMMTHCASNSLSKRFMTDTIEHAETPYKTPLPLREICPREALQELDYSLWSSLGMAGR